MSRIITEIYSKAIRMNEVSENGRLLELDSKIGLKMLYKSPILGLLIGYFISVIAITAEIFVNSKPFCIKIFK